MTVYQRTTKYSVIGTEKPAVDPKHKRFYERHRAQRMQETKEAKRKRQDIIIEHLNANPFNWYKQ